MVPPEDDFLLDQILRGPHRRLRWVFFEIMPLSAAGNPIIAGTGRYAYWRDWERTRLLTDCFFQECRDVCDAPGGRGAPLAEKMQALGRSFGVWLENLRLFVVNYANLGYGQSLLLGEIGPTKEWRKRAVKKDDVWDGWGAPEKNSGMNAQRRAEYDRDFATLLAEDQRFDPGDPISLKALRIKIDRLVKAGVTPIMVIPPTVAPKRYFPAELAGALPIFDFSDPKKYPELFTLDHRLDGGHLNGPGAEIFSDLLARRFLEIAGKTKAAPEARAP
jgi:hypothetical protein